MGVKKLLNRVMPMCAARLVYRLASAALLIGIVMLVEGCGGGSASSQVVQAPQPISISVAPGQVSVVQGSSQQFTATGKFASGGSQDLTDSVSWSSSAQNVATVSSTGLVTTLSAGQSSISASAGAITGSASLVVETPSSQPGALGTAAATPITCPNSPVISTACYAVTISNCPNINDLTGYVKVTAPAGTPVGTVVFSTGANGTSLYEDPSFATHGVTTLNNVLQGGFTLAQISWGEPFSASTPTGWQTGPGGIRAVACRYATLAQWIYNNVHLANKSAPFCATGNSGGAQLIGLALAHYGLGSIFAMVEPTSGPPFARQDYACDCLQAATVDPCGRVTDFCVGLTNAQKYVDPAYEPTIANACSQEVQTPGDTVNDALFLNDSVTAPDAVLNYPNTFVNFVFGSQDVSTAPNQGNLWYNAITSSKAESCVATAPHTIPEDLAGAQQIASDLLKFCKLP